MHPREFKRQRTGTGRVTRVSLLNSEILVGVDFTHHERLNRILADQDHFPVLLFPGKNTLNMSSSDFHSGSFPRQPLVIILDATWASARKMLNESENLQALPRVSFDYGGDSRFVIKRQPTTDALSSIEATYRVLELLNDRGYECLAGEHHTLVETLDAIVAFQIRCEEDPALPSHRLNSKKYRAITNTPG